MCPAGAAQDAVKGVIGDSLGGINLGGLGGGGGFGGFGI